MSHFSKMVNVAVQLPDGERALVAIEDSCPLWDILNRIVITHPTLLNDDNMEPCLSFNRQNFKGAEVLRNKSLKSCGIVDRTLLRLSFGPKSNNNQAMASEKGDLNTSKNTIKTHTSEVQKSTSVHTRPSDDCKTISPDKSTTVHKGCSESSSEKFSKMDSGESSLTQPHQTSNLQSFSCRALPQFPDEVQPFSWMPDNPSHNDSTYSYEPSRMPFADFKFPPKTETDDQNDNNEKSAAENESHLEDREMKVFCLKDVNFELDDIPDGFFEVTTEDVKKMQVLRQKEIAQMQDQPFMSVELKKRKIIEKYSNLSTLRFLFPDRTVVQAKFLLTETSKSLYKFIDSILLPEVAELNSYELFITPPKQVFSKKVTKSLYDLHLYPAVNVHVSLGKNVNQNTYLRPDVLSQVLHPESVLTTYGVGETSGNEAEGLKSPTSSGSNSTSSSAVVKKSVPKDAPKWFAAGLKK